MPKLNLCSRFWQPRALTCHRGYPCSLRCKYLEYLGGELTIPGFMLATPLRRFRPFGDKREICRVRIPELSFNLSIAMTHRDPTRTSGATKAAPEDGCYWDRV